MAMSSIGSIGAFGPTGRLGQVVGRQTVAKTGDGEEIVALRVRSTQPVRPEEATSNARPVGVPQSLRIRPTAPAEPGSGPGIPTAARTPDKLSPEERAAVDRLQQRDAQVRQEEQAHAAVAGDLAGAINYVYQTGPDGRRYAVGGSVPLRAQTLSGDPAEAARLGARIAAAAHAATNPSGADLAAARQGYQLAASAGDPANQSRRPGDTLDIFA